MKRKLLALLLVAFSVCSKAQLLTTNPDFLQESSATVEITCDATFGNQGLKDYATTSDVYVHLGAITSLSTSAADWKYVKFTWATTNPSAQCTYSSANKWKFTITGGLRNFFGITNPAETIKKIAILYRNGAGTKVQRNTDASDMYVTVYDNGVFARVDNPYRQPMYIPTPEPLVKNVGDIVNITGKASVASTLNLYFNGTLVNSAAGVTQLSSTGTIASPGTQTVVAEAINGTVINRDTVSFLVAGAVNIAALPTGLQDGINYETDPTAVTLVLYAPSKTRVAVVGDFNTWSPTLVHQMNKTPDGNRWWLRLTGLTAGAEYAYQYVIDNSLKVADSYAEKILDPNNDQYIPSANYPSLKPYPTGQTSGIVSVFQTAKAPFNWTATTFTRPNKKNLVIYELLVRDFLAAPNWQTLRDTLNYLQKLGINTIELMPSNEFEGNLSWGYNPSFFFAPDKYYGTETAFKQFVDAAHARGIAVVMDIAMNHAFGQSPLVQMYWNSASNQPAANSPWFNQTATHPYSVGYDFNHESQATKDLTARVIRHWMTNYKIDGFRWDLSKGFTQTNSGSDVNYWSQYDASRVTIWKRYYDSMQVVAPGSYCILEHFATNSEEIELSNYGMLLWANATFNFQQATMGFNSGWDWSSGVFTNRGWSNPHLVTYQESHDEERLMYKNTQFGNSFGAYNVRNTTVALKRDEMAAAFWAVIPGPKMLWQFGELGYDYSINFCTNGTINNNCRTDSKPIRWDYLTDPDRKSLYNVYAAMLKLRNVPAYYNAFITSNMSWDLSGAFKRFQINDPALRITVIGNFDVVQQSSSITFPVAGTWYNYLTGATFTATGSAQSITLQPGEYYVYVDRNASQVVLSIHNYQGTTIPKKDSAGYVYDMKVRVNPNPANAASYAEYSLLRSGNFALTIVDMNGKELVQLENSYKTKGTYKLSLYNKNFAIGKLSSGMYFIKGVLNSKSVIEKFIIIN